MPVSAQRWIGIIITFLGVAVTPAVAQEVRVPMDRDSTLYTIDAELRQELGLFSDVSGFERAELYREGAGQYELVIYFQRDGQRLRDRRTLSASEVEALRARVAEGLPAARQTRDLNQDGRYELIASTTTLGLAEGALLAVATEVEGGGAVAFPLFSGTAGFFVPLFATQNARVTEGEASMTFYGGVQGYAHAAHLVAQFDDSDQAGAATAALFGAVESTAGYLTARRNNWSGGHAEMVGFNGASGNLLGLGAGVAVLGDKDGRGSDGNRERFLAASSFLGSVGGMVLGHRMGRSDRYTRGDARVYILSGVQAVNLTGSFLKLSEADTRPVALTLTGAGIGGLAAGRFLVRDRDFTEMQGNLVILGSSAGSLFGIGMAAALETDEEGGVLLQALGSIAGFGITYGAFVREAKRQAGLNTAAVDVDLQVAPTTEPVPTPGPTSAQRSTDVVPEVTLTMQF